MKRFISVEDYDGTISAYEESEKTKPLDNMYPDWAEYVWQFADTHEQAISQHYKKFEMFNSDCNEGREPRETY